MLTIAAQFFIAAVVIVAAGSALVRFADAIAERTGIGKLLAGGLFLAAATSLPEITVDFNAIHIGEPDLAVGDLLGSSFFNLLILMGVSALFWVPKTAPEHPEQHAIAATLSITLTATVAVGLTANLEISLLRAGIFPWVAFLCYLPGLWLLLQKSRVTRITKEREDNAPPVMPLAKAATGYVICAAVILMAAPYVAEAADSLATISGLGHSFIGTTLVALSTSLPELVATIAAFRMRCPDLALGNIFGSNCFNMVMFLPLDWYYEGNLLHNAADVHAVSALGVIFATSVAVITLLHAPSQRRAVLLGNGLVIASILAALILLYHLKGAGA